MCALAEDQLPSGEVVQAKGVGRRLTLCLIIICCSADSVDSDVSQPDGCAAGGKGGEAEQEAAAG